MTSMVINMKAKKRLIIFVNAMALLLCACQQAPTRNQVVSKNDGVFDIHATQTVSSNDDEDELTSINLEDSFSSTDQSVSFSYKIQEEIKFNGVPIVEVVPHYLTSQDAKHIAEVLFGNATFYELQPRFGVVYSKSQIQDKLQKWSSYANEDAIKYLYGDYNENILSVLRSFIEEYTNKLDSAPLDDPRILCKWDFQKSLLYTYTEDELKKMENDLENDSEEIAASVCLNDIEYQFSVMTRDRNDFKLSYISVVPDFGMSPFDIDTRVLLSEHCRTNKPTSKQISNAQSKVSEWLDEMDLGQWSIDQCYVQEENYGEYNEYRICIKAIPEFCGIASIRRPQLSNLKSKNTYASNFYMTEAEFTLSPTGEFLGLQLVSPLDIVAVVNENPVVLDINELLEIAKNHLQLSDIYSYDVGNMMGSGGLDFNCFVNINKLEYGLSRVKVPNTEDCYYYVPSVVLRGNKEYHLADTDELCFLNEDTTILILNAVDGSIIPIANE